MLSEEQIKQIEAYAEKLLNSGSFDDAEDKESFLKAHIALVNDFSRAIDNGEFEVFTDTIKEAVEKSRKEIWAYTGQ